MFDTHIHATPRRVAKVLREVLGGLLHRVVPVVVIFQLEHYMMHSMIMVRNGHGLWQEGLTGNRVDVNRFRFTLHGQG